MHSPVSCILLNVRSVLEYVKQLSELSRPFPSATLILQDAELPCSRRLRGLSHIGR